MPFKNPKSRAARAAHARAKRKWRQANAPLRPFVGVDGEGAGADEYGRQHYLMLRVGDALLGNGRKPLTTTQCLAFLADLEPGPIYVGYFFDYDATQILRDMPPERVARLFERGDRAYHAVEWQGFEVDYLPRKYLKVRRSGTKHWVSVSDVGSFFQCGFVKALTDWNIGTAEERAEVERGKARRGGERLTAADERYNVLEVRLLADLMTSFRKVCRDLDLAPRAWQGPGYLAKALMAKHGVPKREEYEERVPERVRAFAQDAFYGGRFERWHVGEVRGPVYAYDINSAYPRAMLDLPCLLHGKWRKGEKLRTTRGPSADIFVADVTFEHKKDSAKYACDLPVRSPEGVISWPRRGRGVYWSWELDASAATYRIHEAWRYVRRCECKPFAWVPAVYAERKALGKQGKGYVLKLALNSIYGSCAQSVGSAPYANPVWAGLITARTRAEIVRAYRGHEKALVMVATDGVFATEPLGVECGPELGEWEEKVHDPSPPFFVVQPGLYFGAEKMRTRGVARAAVEKMEGKIRAAWRKWSGRGEFPAIAVPVTLFTGLKLASARGKVETAGTWVEAEKRLSFDPRNKSKWNGKGKRLTPLRGGAKSVPYSKIIGAYRDAPALARLEMEAMPDYEPGIGGG